MRTDDGRRDVCGNVATHPSHSSGIIVSYHHLIVGHRGRVHRNAIDIRNAKSFVLRRKIGGIAKGHHTHLLVAESPLSGAGVHPERLCLRRRRRIAPTKAATFENNISDGSHIAHIDFAIFIHITNFQIAFSGKHQAHHSGHIAHIHIAINVDVALQCCWSAGVAKLHTHQIGERNPRLSAIGAMRHQCAIGKGDFHLSGGNGAFSAISRGQIQICKSLRHERHTCKEQKR